MSEETKPQESMVSSIIKAMEEDSKKFGSALVKNATESFDKDRTAALINRVKELVRHRMNLYAALEKTKQEIALFDRRISAIDAGEFALDGHTGNIIFKDANLNY
jgi:hypothetical protein